MPKCMASARRKERRVGDINVEPFDGVAEPRPEGSAARVALVLRSGQRSLPVAARFSLRCYMPSIFKSCTQECRRGTQMCVRYV
jgi:hypothetical protein